MPDGDKIGTDANEREADATKSTRATYFVPFFVGEERVTLGIYHK